jgi:UDP-N-acetylmuramate: L-alanyl-gamma-D-glutamyl-meso-diaminopimelate ligase
MAKLPTFQELKTVHIIGVCGTLMGAFAAFLKRKGITVTGSDQNVYPPMSDVLKGAGVKLFSGYSEENLKSLEYKPDLVVIGNVINKANPEAAYAITHGYAYTSLPEAMEKLMLSDTRNLVVAGTHGKTTTSSLLAFVLANAKKDPSYFIGGVSHDLPFSFHVPSIDAGQYFILEGDEYDTAFWDKVPKFNHYLPNDVILTSVEFDHADIYADLKAVEKAFEGLMSRIRPEGRLIACTDYESVKKLLPLAKVPVLTYSATKGNARFTPVEVKNDPEFSRFKVWDDESKTTSAEVSIRLPGQHNVMNALSVFIECKELGLSEAEIITGLSKFQGVKRRQEIRGEVKGVIVLDDFAHHPTAVKETLLALKNRYPQKRLVTIFEPRSATSRRKVFQNDYAQAFAKADAVYIAAPFDQSKIAAEDQFSSEQLVQDIQKQGRPARVFLTVEDGVKEVAKSSQPGDLIAVLSNGGFGGFIPQLLEMLSRNP